MGEKSLRSIVELSGRVSDRALPQDREAIGKLAGDVSSMTDALCELRASGQVRAERYEAGQGIGGCMSVGVINV